MVDWGSTILVLTVIFNIASFVISDLGDTSRLCGYAVFDGKAIVNEGNGVDFVLNFYQFGFYSLGIKAT